MPVDGNRQREYTVFIERIFQGDAGPEATADYHRHSKSVKLAGFRHSHLAVVRRGGRFSVRESPRHYVHALTGTYTILIVVGYLLSPASQPEPIMERFGVIEEAVHGPFGARTARSNRHPQGFVSYLLHLRRGRPKTAAARGRSVARMSDGLHLLQSLQSRCRFDRHIVDVRGVQTAAFLERVLRNRCKERLELLLHRYEEPDVIRIPTEIHRRVEWHHLIGIGS